MNLFDALLLANLCLVAVAWVRLQPAAFVWFGQQCTTIRALSNIRDYGAPASQSWLPASLFNAASLDTAFYIFLLSTLICAVGLLVPSADKKPSAGGVFKRLPTWINVLVWLFFLTATLSRRSIMAAAHTSEEAEVFGFNLGGGNALVCGLLLYDIETRRLAGRLSGRKAFAIVFAILAIAFMLKGGTGYATGCLLLAAFLYLGQAKIGPLPGYVAIGLAVGILISSTMFIRETRSTLASEGSEAVSSAVENMEGLESRRASTGVGFESLLNGDQSAAHVCECINLWESNIGRGWRSIYNPLIYTFEPSFLLEPLGLTRPREASYELLDYYLHAGGIQALGEMYWNGGFLCVVVVVALLALMNRRCDLNYNKNGYWLMMVCNYVPSAFIGGHYGIAQIMRGVINGLIACALLRLFGRVPLQPQRLV